MNVEATVHPKGPGPQRRWLLVLAFLLGLSPAIAPAEPVASFSQVKGQVSVQDRSADIGDTVSEGDMIRTGDDSHAVLLFSDDSAMTLRPNTQLRISRFRHQPVSAKQDSAIFSLIRGGLRVITGLISKRRQEAVRFHTPVATVGIRGTAFDLRCDGLCAGLGRDMGEVGRGLYTWVRSGAVSLNRQSRELMVASAGQAALIDANSGRAIRLPQVPAFMRNDPTPLPDGFSGLGGSLVGGTPSAAGSRAVSDRVLIGGKAKQTTAVGSAANASVGSGASSSTAVGTIGAD